MQGHSVASEGSEISPPVSMVRLLHWKSSTTPLVHPTVRCTAEAGCVCVHVCTCVCVCVCVCVMDTFGLVAVVALYCNGFASNSWYVLLG